jgi:hypothetical protein
VARLELSAGCGLGLTGTFAAPGRDRGFVAGDDVLA